MSRKGTPSDNACIESFHASLKSETFYLDGLTNEPTSIVIEIVKNTLIIIMKVEFNKTRLPIADRLSEISSLGKCFLFLSHNLRSVPKSSRDFLNFSHCFFHKRNTLMSPFRNQQRKLHKSKEYTGPLRISKITWLPTSDILFFALACILKRINLITILVKNINKAFF